MILGLRDGSTRFSYIVEAGEIDKQDFINTVKTCLSSMSEVKIMTLAEQFRQEGKQEGIQEGYQKGQTDGIEKGKLEALKTIAMNLFEQGMTVAQVAKITGLSVWDTEQLKNNSSN